MEGAFLDAAVLFAARRAAAQRGSMFGPLPRDSRGPPSWPHFMVTLSLPLSLSLSLSPLGSRIADGVGSRGRRPVNRPTKRRVYIP